MPIHTRKGKNGNTYRVSVMRKGKRLSKTFKRRSDAEKFQALLTIDDSFINRIFHRTSQSYRIYKNRMNSYKLSK